MTLIDDEKLLISGGVLFTAYEREEIFDWLLQNLREILGFPLGPIFREDSASFRTRADFRIGSHPDVAHRLCIFRKKANFTRQVTAARATPAFKDQRRGDSGIR
jgi:hypothetical protein